MNKGDIDFPLETLKSVVAELGIDNLSERRKVVGMFSDKAPSVSGYPDLRIQNDKKMVARMYDEGVFALLMDSHNCTVEEKAIAIKKAVARLCNSYVDKTVAEKFVDMLVVALNWEDPTTLFNLGKAHLTSSPNTAFMLMKQAAKQGYAEAQHKLGEMYGNGLGVEQDYAEWFDGYNSPIARDATPEQRDFAANWAFFVEGIADPIAAPDDLNRLLKEHWSHAEALFVQMPDEFTEWLESNKAYAEIAKVVQSRVSLGERSLRIQQAIAPSKPLFFRGVELSSEGMATMIQSGLRGDAEASDWLDEMLQHKVLATWGLLKNIAGLNVVQEQIIKWRAKARKLAGTTVYEQLYKDSEPRLLPLLFETALSDDPAVKAGSTIVNKGRLTSQVKELQADIRECETDVYGGAAIKQMVDDIAEKPYDAELIPLYLVARPVLLIGAKKAITKQPKWASPTTQ
jgi:hypothetical protein